MKITYVAKHNSGNADDEGAIKYALDELGHTVTCYQEQHGSEEIVDTPADLLLFHHWTDTVTLGRVKCPKVFWYFDMVAADDETLVSRNVRRIQWMNKIVPLVDLGFCTDGDWVVNYDQPKKLVWLCQGADKRVMGVGNVIPGWSEVPILFTGDHRGGVKRRSFVEELRTRYGSKFTWIRSGMYGRDLADLIASSYMVVAPDGPVTDRYWSNRVYTTLGYGGLLLHPYCTNLTTQYANGMEIIYYNDRDDLHRIITRYLDKPETGIVIGEAGLKRTYAWHTYTHRVERLLEIVKERLL